MSAPPRPRPPLAFVSYDPNEVELRDQVLALANRLRRDGVEARIDLYEPSPAEGWELWRERQLLSADFVIVVCTPSYRRCFEAHDPDSSGLQVRWEAGFVRRRLRDEPSFGARVLPVLLHDAHTDAVPEVLRGCTRHALPSDYDELYRRITGQPAIIRPPLGMLGHRIDNLPPRSLVFEGRDDDLHATRDALRLSIKLMTYTVLTGMGGVGKTRLALEHAYRSEGDYDLRWWVRAGDPVADLVRLGVTLGILSQPEHSEASTREVLTWLSTHQRWLLVYDDAEGPTTLRELLPRPSQGHVIITSRARAWRSIAQVVEIKRLSPAAARMVLAQRSGRPDDGHADAVAESLGHLPLALVQAGAYVEATGCSFGDYLNRFAQEGLSLLDDPKSIPDGDHETVARMWEMSLAEIRKRSLAAAALLDWLAFLHPGGVPIRLLGEQVTAMPAPLCDCVKSPRALDDAIATLHEFGMMDRDEGVLRVHQLIQAVTRDKLATHERRQLAAAVVRWVCAVFAYSPGKTRVGDIPMGIAEQVIAVSSIETHAPVETDRLAQALIDLGDFQLVRGACHLAHSAYTRSLELRRARRAARPDCARARRDLSIALNRLGAVESRAGSLASARVRFSEAFELRKILAYEDPFSPQRRDDLASSLSKLGDVELRANDLTAAAILFVQAVELREALVDAAPEDTLARRALALSSRKLGKTQAGLGYIEDARCTLQRALELAEALAFEAPHDPVARRDLAFVLKELSDVLDQDDEHELVREHLARALAIVEALAAEDPGSAQAQRDLSICLNRLGLVEQHAGRLVQARSAMKRALVLREALACADSHDAQAKRDLALSLVKLGDLEQQAGDTALGYEYHRRAADIQTALMLEHPGDAPELGDQSAVHDARGARSRSPTATMAACADLTRGVRVVPHEHTRGSESKYLEAMCHAHDLQRFGTAALRSGNLATARRSFRLLVSITDVLAKVDPRPSQAQHRAASALCNLGRTERELGKLEAARASFRRCTRLLDSQLEAAPGEASARRELAVCHRELGAVEQRLGNLEGARELLERSVAILEALVLEHPRDGIVLRDLGASLVALGNLEWAATELEAARKQLQRNLDVAYASTELEASGSTTGHEVLLALRLLAEAELRLDNHPEARELFRRMLDEERALAQADQADAWAALDLVLLHAEHSTHTA